MGVIVSREFWLIGPRFAVYGQTALRPEVDSAEEMRPEDSTVVELRPDVGQVVTPQVVAVDPEPLITSAEDLKPTIQPTHLTPSIGSVTEE